MPHKSVQIEPRYFEIENIIQNFCIAQILSKSCQEVKAIQPIMFFYDVLKIGVEGTPAEEKRQIEKGPQIVNVNWPDVNLPAGGEVVLFPVFS